MAEVKKMYDGRFDLSDYLIHFTRNRETTSFASLLEIIRSGRLNCGWSVRNGKRTVFGPYPAVCFTDMPLFSFYQYVNNRKDTTKVDFYGVALNKKEMFQLGARNVIYGTTVYGTEPESELGTELPPEMQNGNLTVGEQYRYMLTAIKDTNDWTHEREWRWTNQYGLSKGDYLPVWLTNEYNKDLGDRDFRFQYPIFVIVRTEDEIARLKDFFLGLDTSFNKVNINNTYGISLERISAKGLCSYNGMSFPSLFNQEVAVKLI